MPLIQVVRGDCEGRARAAARRPCAGCGVIAQDFAFRGNNAANKLQNFHDHELIMGRAAVPPRQSGRNGRARLLRRRGSLSVKGTGRKRREIGSP
jgi:hypothetical protein